MSHGHLHERGAGCEWPQGVARPRGAPPGCSIRAHLWQQIAECLLSSKHISPSDGPFNPNCAPRPPFGSVVSSSRLISDSAGLALLRWRRSMLRVGEQKRKRSGTHFVSFWRCWAACRAARGRTGWSCRATRAAAAAPIATAAAAAAVVAAKHRQPLPLGLVARAASGCCSALASCTSSSPPSPSCSG